MPSHPTAKNELNTKSRTAETTCVAELSILPRIASSTIVRHCPTAPNSISLRRPILSINAMAMRLARKYSVPLHAAIILALTSSIPRRSKSRVA